MKQKNNLDKLDEIKMKKDEISNLQSQNDNFQNNNFFSNNNDIKQKQEEEDIYARKKRLLHQRDLILKKKKEERENKIKKYQKVRLIIFEFKAL